MKYLLSFAILTGVSLTAFGTYALEDTQCSNADGSLRRVEVEQWGTNDVKWILGGKEIAGAEAKYDQSTNVLLDEKHYTLPYDPGNGALGGMQSGEETYAIRVTIRYADRTSGGEVSEYVICKRTWNDGRD